MDYEKKDLTQALYYGPIKTSHIETPYGRSLNQAISENFHELEDLLLDPKNLKNTQNTLEKLNKFFELMNTNNNIQNMLVYGDEHKAGDAGFSKRLSRLDSAVQEYTENHQKLFPVLIEIQAIWDASKEQIPEKIELIHSTRQNIRSILEARSNHRELEKINTAESKFNTHISAPNALNKSWKSATPPEEPFWKKLAPSFGISSVTNTRGPAPAGKVDNTYTAQL